MKAIPIGVMLFAILLLPISWAAPLFTAPELTTDYITIVDERGNIIMQTGLSVRPGDEYISEDNRLYEVVVVEGILAKARFVGNETLASESSTRAVQAPVAQPPVPQPDAPSAPDLSEPQPSYSVPPTPPPQLIAVYYTHSDESYTPTDGAATTPGNGGIFKVGSAFSQRLADLGYQVENDMTRHEPHDANAYQRSRRTFTRLLQHQPAALFDLHRDSAPANIYQTTINGKSAAKILLVVGRQNQNRQTTMDYAKGIKAAADSKYSGLVRGIFIAHGNYNQDLNPRAMLVEVGTQGNSREAAEYSATLFADLVPLFLAANPAPTAGSAPAIGPDGGMPPPQSYTKDIITIVGVLIAGAIGFLAISTGSWQEAKRKLAHFRKTEFANFFGPRRGRKK